MLAVAEKEKLVQIVSEAGHDGAGLKRACNTVGIAFKTFRRWKTGNTTDKRKGAPKNVVRKLSNIEVEQFYQEACSERFKDKTPGQIVSNLLEEGIWHGSERTLYRILKTRNALQSRTESRKPSSSKKPAELVADGPHQVWTWDITWLKTEVAGIFLYAYVIIDLFSRKVVGWTLEQSENPELARNLFARVIRDTGFSPRFVHADNGGPMRGLTLVAFLTNLNIGMSFSRPRVSDDNPFIESFFKTLKYRVGYPKTFKDIATARTWFATFVNWYNHEHRHSGIDYFTPNQRHSGEYIGLRNLRQKTLEIARQAHPERFVRPSKNINADVDKVFLNPA